jgi:RimJ/RimL family protein N-acetyltransferase
VSRVKSPVSCTLAGRLVRLEPLRLEHAADLFAGYDEDRSVFRWLPQPRPPETEAEMRTLVERHLALRDRGDEIAFAQVSAATGRAVGITKYLSIAIADSGLEVGGTWLAKAAQRTGVNREAKYLLLRHAFEELGAIRVQLKTDARNATSQRAIAALGAVREGVLRKHKLCWDGFVRDSVIFSITDGEWPSIKSSLEAQLARPALASR